MLKWIKEKTKGYKTISGLVVAAAGGILYLSGQTTLGQTVFLSGLTLAGIGLGGKLERVE